MTRFRNRAEAGRLLAERLRDYADRDDVIVLGLPRGGVPVAYEVARALGAPLDVFLVRKLGVPGQEELAMGAIASSGTRVINPEVVAAAGVGPDAIEAVAAREKVELDRRERAYRGTRPRPDLAGRTVILVDDGLATGRRCSRPWRPWARRGRRGSSSRCRGRPGGLRRDPPPRRRRGLPDDAAAAPLRRHMVRRLLGDHRLRSPEAARSRSPGTSRRAITRPPSAPASVTRASTTSVPIRRCTPTRPGLPAPSRASEALQQLVELQAGTIDDTMLGDDRHFWAEQNARLVANAERYYRAVFRGGARSWNLRDRRMAETLETLVAHLRLTRGASKVVVGAHNHVGDARATELARGGQLNLGQLVRERHRRRVLNIGFTTFRGTVTAASEWGGTAERMRVRRALTGGWEDLFHRRGLPRFLVDTERLAGVRLERAIGVVYVPQTERQSHYFHARLANQFDAMIHIDATSAVEPLAVRSERLAGDLPETYPWGV